jgi:hypothetical protein
VGDMIDFIRVNRSKSKEPPGDPDVRPTWWSPPGSRKRFCMGCEHWFSSFGDPLCPDCVEMWRKQQKQEWSGQQKKPPPDGGSGEIGL